MNNVTKILMAGAAVVALSVPAYAQNSNARTGLGVGVDTGVVSTKANVDTRVKTRGNTHVHTYGDDMIETRTRAVGRTAGSSNSADIRWNSNANADARYRGMDNRTRVDVNADPNANAYLRANSNARFMDDYDMTRADTRDLQMRLKRAGYQVSADGVLGPRTRAAIEEYQMDNNLDVTGSLDNDTLDLLNSGEIMARPNVRNRSDFNAMSRADIRDLQLRLDDAGYNLSADGYVGTRTRAALREYQAANDLAITGRLDAATKASLNLN